MIISGKSSYLEIWTKLQEDSATTGDEGKGLYKETQFLVRVGEKEDIIKSQEVGYFFLSPLPGCCGIVVSHATHLHPSFRSTEYGKSFHRVKENVARHYGYSMMLATTELRNLPEIIGGSKAGWKWGNFFRNKRTTHDLAIGLKELL